MAFKETPGSSDRSPCLYPTCPSPWQPASLSRAGVQQCGLGAMFTDVSITISPGLFEGQEEEPVDKRAFLGFPRQHGALQT